MDQAVVATRPEYFAFVFVASVGVLQLTAILAGLKGLLFFRRPALAYPFSILAIAGAFYWFFVRSDRIDTIMRRVGLEGSQQFYYFCVSAFAALIFTLVVSSLIDVFRRQTQSNNCGEKRQGLNSLREMSYLKAIKRSFRSKED